MSTPPPDYVPGFVCQLNTCSITEWGYIHYQPSVAGNALFLAIFFVILICQIYLGIRYKTGGTAIAMGLGLGTEILGYIARVLLHGDPFDRDYFLWYLITLTIGPVFIAAAIYLSLGRIVMMYGEEISRIRPRNYTVFFLGCDVVSLVIQAAGGGIAASTPVTNQPLIDTGTHVLVAGLSFQVASLAAFSLCSLEFLLRVKKHPNLRNPEFTDVVKSTKFKMFLYSLFGATTFLFIRTVFRSVELSGGFKGKLANNEVEFMILDGVMVILASLCLTVGHPGLCFGQRWKEAVFQFRKSKAPRGQAGAHMNAAGDLEAGEKAGPEVSEAVIAGTPTSSHKD
ncbi:hypothetical protein MMC25_003338 [Agyrium rufum]|nr:hypothetical protein [Agyrium rufum]